jgi:hypothetical protein
MLKKSPEAAVQLPGRRLTEALKHIAGCLQTEPVCFRALTPKGWNACCRCFYAVNSAVADAGITVINIRYLTHKKCMMTTVVKAYCRLLWQTYNNRTGCGE